MTEPITRKEFQEHCDSNDVTAKSVVKLEKLLPLVDLIPTLQEIVENQKATIIVGRKALRIIGYISAALGLLYLIFRFWREVKH